MTLRVIEFKMDVLLDPDVYCAMCTDGVESWEVAGSGHETYIQDSKGTDFPKLRTLFLAKHYSYNFHERNKGDGDHTFWYHGRSGKEHTSNFGHADVEIVLLRDLDK